MRMRIFGPLLAAVLGLGCGDRPDVYQAPVSQVSALGLESQVALIDDGAHRVVLLSPHDGQELDRTYLGIGKNVVLSQTSDDGKRLFVLSAGDVIRRKSTDERASLSVIENGERKRYELESPHSGFAIDPQGRWIALFAAPSSSGTVRTSFVENPNEIVLVDLTAPVDKAVTSRTLRSFGGLPQRVSFTPQLGLPGGARRLLVVETDQDVALLDLDNVRATPARPELTVRLTEGSTAQANQPGGVVFDDGDPAKSDDARIGVRLANGSNVVTVTLVPSLPDAKTEDPAMVPNDFRAIVNLTDVGGIPGEIVFVRTEAGRRLAAVVPATKKAVLVDPDTSITTEVDLQESFSRISLITSVVGGTGGADTALLYGSGGSRGVAFLSLGKAEGTPYRSVEVVSLATAVDTVEDVPPPRPELKVLQTSAASSFYVLNLASRTAAPLLTQGAASLHVARDGQRLWAFSNTNLSRVSLDDLHPVPLPLERNIDAVFDVARRDGGRALVAIDKRGTVGATVLDALAPDTAASRSYYGLLLEGLE